MFDPTSLSISLASRRLRIRRLYWAGDLTTEIATAQLLRIDIDEVARARRLKAQAEPHPAPVSGHGGDPAA
jgi:hypothetical protein